MPRLKLSPPPHRRIVPQASALTLQNCRSPCPRQPIWADPNLARPNPSIIWFWDSVKAREAYLISPFLFGPLAPLCCGGYSIVPFLSSSPLVPGRRYLGYPLTPRIGPYLTPDNSRYNPCLPPPFLFPPRPNISRPEVCLRVVWSPPPLFAVEAEPLFLRDGSFRHFFRHKHNVEWNTTRRRRCHLANVEICILS